MSIEETTRFIPNSIEGDASQGGWSVSGAFANAQALCEYGRRSELYVLIEGGGIWETNFKLTLRGSMLPRSLTFDKRQSSLDAVISTSNVFLNNAGLQGIYFAVVGAPVNPHQSTYWTLGSIVKHIVQDHTNISTNVGGWVDISNIDTINSSSIEVYTVRQNNSIWSVIENIASNEFYVRYFDKEDKLYYRPHPQFAGVPNPVVVNLDSSNIVGQPTITFRDGVKLDQVRLYALTDSGAILTSFYPLNVGTEGRREQYTNLRCNSQARLNQLAIRSFKFLNRDFTLKITIPGAFCAFLELYDRVSITYTGTTENGVTVAWTDKKFYIMRISTQRQGNTGRFAYTELDLEEELL